MPTTILTQEQQNYVFMLLIAGDLPENEIRMFLARSGWSLDSIDAGVLYAQSSELVHKLNMMRAPKGTAIPVSAPVPSGNAAVVDQVSPIVNREAPTSAAVEPNTVTPSMVTSAPIAVTISPIPKADPYKESASLAEADFKQVIATNPEFKTANTTSMIMPKSSVVSDSGMSPVRTMPPVPKHSPLHGILVFLAWLLFLILVGLVAAIVGYMYYTGGGIFENVVYTKLF